MERKINRNYQKVYCFAINVTLTATVDGRTIIYDIVVKRSVAMYSQDYSDVTNGTTELYSGEVKVNGNGYLKGMYILSGRGSGLTKNLMPFYIIGLGCQKVIDL